MRTRLKNIIIYCFLSVNFTLAQNTEQLVKSTFIEKFFDFIEWKSEKIDTSDYFYIAVTKNSTLSPSLKTVLKDKRVNGKPIKVINSSKLTEIPKSIHMLILGDETDNDVETLISFASANNILLIGETDNYAEQGVHLNFYITKEQTVHFILNLRSMKEANLRPKLLLIEVAKVI